MKSKRLEAVVTGGNHLAAVLVQHIGPDFDERFPPRGDPEKVMTDLHQLFSREWASALHDVWVCWAAIQNAKHLLGDPEAAARFEASRVKCEACHGKGKHMVRKGLAQPRELVCDTCKGAGFVKVTPAS